jgi:glycyl-tRNA synthetase beta chain
VSVSATLLVELFTEELPPKALKHLGKAFAEALAAGLRSRDFLAADSEATPYATPRRLGVAITKVANSATEPARAIPLLPINVAFSADRKPTEALQKAIKAKTGFDDFVNVPAERIERRNDGKLERVFYIEPPILVPLRGALQEALEDALAKLPMPKVMSYADPGGYYNDQKFVRPAHGLIALHGAEIVPVSALGLSAGRTTGGHRFASRPDIEIAGADAYAPTLEAEGKVLPGFRERRSRIVAGLEAAANGASIVMPDALLDEVTALVEWPKVYTGGFDAAFLEVPQECLILTMQQNQKYFALEGRDGRLQNRFLLVCNIDAHDPEPIVRGNERVLRARLTDAKFFYDQDLKTPLAARVAGLRGIVYHNKLGTQAERTDRLRFLAARIAPLLGADVAQADRAAMLAKADLITSMVGEFPELQGTMGRYYALHDGEPPAVADAIEQHYWPRFAGDALPEATVAQAVALGDKLETVVGMFGVGQIPTGDKDPFGLRRASLGIVRILVERKRRISLSGLVDLAYAALNAVRGVVLQRELILDFIYERLRGYLRDQGFTANQVASVIDARPDAVDDVIARLVAVREFETLPEAGALAAANKRVINILRKSGAEALPALKRERLAEDAERQLCTELEQRLLPAVNGHVKKGEFTEALLALAAARAPVDRFFDEVLVMADDPDLRGNRLALLRGLADAMNQVADISKLAV